MRSLERCDSGRMDEAGTRGGGPIPGTGYALRHVLVAPCLSALRGPLIGRLQLPLRLDASARHVYAFPDEQWRELAYRTVLLEAGTVTDLEQWLDGRELMRLWQQLYLPRVVRAAWQDRHPAWPGSGAGPRVAAP